jgi:hypothetical protein
MLGAIKRRIYERRILRVVYVGQTTEVVVPLTLTTAT